MIPEIVRYSVILTVVASLCACGLPGQSDEEVWQSLYDLGFVAQTEKKWDVAADNYSKALKLARSLDNNQKLVGNSLLGLGECAVAQGKYLRAAQYLKECEEVFEKLWNPAIGGVNNRDNAIYLAKARLSYAQALAGLNSLQDAHYTIKQARAVAESAPAPDYLEHDIIAAQAKIVQSLGKTKASNRLKMHAYTFAPPIDPAEDGGEEYKAGDWRTLLKASDESLGALNYDRAREILERVKVQLDTEKIEGVPRGRLYLNLGILQDAKRDYQKAEKSLEEAVRILEKYEPIADNDTAPYFTDDALERLGAVKLHTKQLKEAHKYFEKVLAFEREISHADKWKRRERSVLEALEDVYNKEKNYDRAIAIRKEKMSIEVKLYGTNSKKHGLNFLSLARLCVLAGKDEEASVYFEQAMNNLDSVKNVNPRTRLDVYDEYGKLLEKLGRKDKVLEVRRRADALETDIVKNL